MSAKRPRSIRFDEEMLMLLDNIGENASDTVRKAILFYLDHKDDIDPKHENQLKQNEEFARRWAILAERAPEEAKTDIKQGNLDNLMIVNKSYNGGNDTENVKRIKEMLPFFRVSYDHFIKLLCEGLESGEVSLTEKKLRVVPEYRLDELIETCRYNHVDPGRAIHLAERYVKEGKITCNT